MKYQIIAGPDDNLKPLISHMRQYAIDARYKAATVMSDGSYEEVDGFPVFTLLGLGGSAGAAGLGLATVNPLLGMAVGFVIDALLVKPAKETDAPYPVYRFVEVSWRNISAKRANWAEYLLCKLCARQGWQIHSRLIDDRNMERAKRNSSAPRPWGERRRRNEPSVFNQFMEIFR